MAVMGVFWVPMALLQQTAGYVTAFVAQYYGADRKEHIGGAVWQAIYVSLVGGVLFLGFNFFSKDFFAWVGHSPTMQVLERDYFNALAFSALPTALVATVSGFFTGLGRTRVVIGINFVGLMANIFLDYLLIFGKWGFPELGIVGAGYATAGAAYAAAFYGAYLIFNKKYEAEFSLITKRQLNFEQIKKFLRFGLPSGFQWALEGLAFTVFLILMGKLSNGEAALSSSSIAVTVMMLSVLPAMGIGQAVLTLVGQSLGQKRPDEAQAYTWTGVKIAALYISVVAMSFWFFPSFYISWFYNGDNPELWAQVEELAPRILQFVALFTIFDSLYLTISFALKGAGDTRFVSLVALLVPWPFMVLPTWLTMDREDAAIFSWSFVLIYVIVSSLIIAYRFYQGSWKKLSVI